MHHISKIKVVNFRSIRDGEFSLSPYTALVGCNNAGKTNILQAICWIVKRASLPASDFFDPSLSVVVTAEISGIDGLVLDALADNHRQRVEPLIVDGKLKIRRTQTTPAQTASQIRFEICQMAEGEEQWVINPAGIDAAISHLFPEPIFIGAMEDATEDVGRYAKSTTIGKLITEVIAPITERHSSAVVEALDKISRKLSANSDEKDENLVDLDSRIETELQRFFPGVTAKTHIQAPEFPDFIKNATIKLFDGTANDGVPRDAASFGHGAQRSVQIALVKCLSDLKKGAAIDAGRTTLLLIDEPELYLHPQAIEMVRAALSRLSTEGYQVIFTTHSANMISRADAENVLMIRRTGDLGTTCYPRLRDAVRVAVNDAPTQAEILFELTNSNRFLFADNVILIEGATERALLPELYEFRFSASISEHKSAIIALNGVENVPKAMAVLQAMEIPTKVVADLDFAFRGAIRGGFIQDSHAGITGCRNILTAMAAQSAVTLGNDGLPQKGNGQTAAQAYALLAARQDAIPYIVNIHDHLKLAGIWIWRQGAIEDLLALASKKPSEHARFLLNFRNDAFRQGLPDYASVETLLDWLRPVQ